MHVAPQARRHQADKIVLIYSAATGETHRGTVATQIPQLAEVPPKSPGSLAVVTFVSAWEQNLVMSGSSQN